MNKAKSFLIVLVPLIQSCASNPLKNVAFIPSNKEWCEKSNSALTKTGFDKMYDEKLSEREGAELSGTSYWIDRYSCSPRDRKGQNCSSQNIDNLRFLYSSHNLFCGKAYFELDHEMEGIRHSDNKINLNFLTVNHSNALKFDRDTWINERSGGHWKSGLKLSPDEQNDFYYISNGKNFGEKGFEVSQILEISKIKKAVEFYSINGFSNEFYGDSGLDQPMEKTVELEYPSMSGMSLEEAKSKRKNLLNEFTRSLIRKITNDFAFNPKLRNFALAHLPVPITSEEGNDILEKVMEIETTLFPTQYEAIAKEKIVLEDDPEFRDSYTFEKYYEPPKGEHSYPGTINKEISYSELTDKNPRERFKLFGNYLLANSTFDFKKVSENKVTLKVIIDLPTVAKAYGKKPISEFLVK